MKKALLFTIAILSLSYISHAQEPPNFDDNPPEGDPNAVPIDGGVSLLAAAGIGFAGKKLKMFGSKAK
jgi:hypothetical protein